MTNSNIIEKESFFWSPDYLEVSAWIEHIPFAFWIIEVLRPKVVVELGVHLGTSYFSFCQAIKTLNVSAACYGVDTWKGDEHAGLYDEEIYRKVTAYNNSHYARFSTLIRSSFDEANQYFIDKTIELLHIDGLHTYEAVKHDFETWLPKLSANAIVVFHDINVRERQFGVFKLWEELKQQYQHFQFDFGHGLGILAIGQVDQEELSILFNNDKASSYYLFLRNLFSDRGSAFKASLDFGIALNHEREKYQALERQYNRQTEINKSLETENKNVTKSYHILETNYALLDNTFKNLLKGNEELKEDNKKLQLINKELEDKYETEIADLSRNLNTANTSYTAVSNELNQVKKDNELFQKYLDWYKATFVDRSMLGVIKEKYKMKFKDFYKKKIDSLLEKESIKKKYAINYSLDYVKENGIQFTFSKIVSLVKEDGFKSFTRSALRKKAVEKLSSKTKPVLLAPVPSIDISLIKKDIDELSYKPKISLIFPTYNTKPDLLDLAIKSVKNQVYQNWELCIVDDCSTKKETKKLLKAYKDDPNIKVLYSDKNVGISEASNAAIKLATGDFIGLMDHDDEITPDALYWVIKKLNEHIDADIIYSDECKVDEQGNLSDYFFKPQWSPELLINMMYIGHLTIYRKAFLLDKVGLFRKEYDFSQDYDLALRATEKTSNIYHIDKVIYHWRITEGSSSQGDKPYARKSNLAALKDAAKRRNINGEVIELPTANRLKIHISPERKVSIIIPTDSYDHLKETIEAIENCTTFSNYEILPVTNTKLIDEISKSILSDKVRYVAYDKPYNFSDKCNEGAVHSAGNVLIFFNDDVRPLQSDWIENTIEFLEVPGVGGVSPKLIYENDTIQYAGMATGVRNLTGTTFHCYEKDSTQYLNFPQLVRNVSILSGACMAIRKDVFMQVNGFDPINTPISHSDVDLSFKILEAGYRCVYTPYATLRHIGHLSLKRLEAQEIKDKKNSKDKADIFLLQRWGKYLQDPYFTSPMKNHLYHDSPEPYQVHAIEKEIKDSGKGNIILVCHDLTLSGAPLMLYNISKILKELEYFVVVVCPNHGPLQKMYQAINIPVIIDDLVLKQHPSFEKFAKNFDFIICNTILSWPVVMQMQGITKTIWWIHEGKLIESYLNNKEFIDTLKSANNIVGVSDYSISFIKEYNKKVIKFYNYCDDKTLINGCEVNRHEKLIFSLVGSIESRKGHDILISALEKIEANLLKDAEIWIIGRKLDNDYLVQLQQRINKIDSIKILGERSHDECIKLMQQSHVILNPSRDDPFPVVLVEALCLGKVCVVSSNSGVSELIQNGVNGYIFKNENIDDLAQKLTYILRNKQSIIEVGKRGRAIYEKHLSYVVAKESWDTYLQNVEL